MNLPRRPDRASDKPSRSARPAAGEHDDLLPWADPYIVSLLREHERQMRGQASARRGRA
jgi:hypothetical protein